MVQTMAKTNGVMEDVAAEIGFTAANALVDWFGGNRIYIPVMATEDHSICRVIGMAAMQRLVTMFAPMTYPRDRFLWVPSGFEREMARRDRMIGAMFAKGATTKEIMDVTYMSKRHVELVRQKLDSIGMLQDLVPSLPEEERRVNPRETEDHALAVMDSEGCSRNFGQK